MRDFGFGFQELIQKFYLEYCNWHYSLFNSNKNPLYASWTPRRLEIMILVSIIIHIKIHFFIRCLMLPRHGFSTKPLMAMNGSSDGNVWQRYLQSISYKYSSIIVILISKTRKMELYYLFHDIMPIVSIFLRNE